MSENEQTLALNDGKVELIIMEGNVVELEVPSENPSSALVVPTNKTNTKGGGLDKSINKVGQLLSERVKNYKEHLKKHESHSVIKRGKTLVYDAKGDLKPTYLIFTNSPVLDELEEDEDEFEEAIQILKNCYNNSLKEGEEREVGIIIFPLLSCGINGDTDHTKTAIKVGLEQVQQYFTKTPESCMETVYFVAFEQKPKEWRLLSEVAEELGLTAA